MAKKQTRRSVSIARSTYDAIMSAAAEQGVSAALIVERGLVRLGIKLPPTEHQSPEAIDKMRRAKGYNRRALIERRYTATSARTVKRYPSRERQLLGDWTANAMGFR